MRQFTVDFIFRLKLQTFNWNTVFSIQFFLYLYTIYTHKFDTHFTINREKWDEIDVNIEQYVFGSRNSCLNKIEYILVTVACYMQQQFTLNLIEYTTEFVLMDDIFPSVDHPFQAFHLTIVRRYLCRRRCRRNEYIVRVYMVLCACAVVLMLLLLREITFIHCCCCYCYCHCYCQCTRINGKKNKKNNNDRRREDDKIKKRDHLMDDNNIKFMLMICHFYQ